jgi:hypothetical protein
MLLPAHRDLDHLVQLVQGRRRRQMNAPPHRRVNLAQRDLDLVNGARSAYGDHRIGVIITESADARITARHAGRRHQGQSGFP